MVPTTHPSLPPDVSLFLGPSSLALLFQLWEKGHEGSFLSEQLGETKTSRCAPDGCLVKEIRWEGAG